MEPFNKLSNDDQKAAVDVSIAALLVSLRIPSTGKPLYDWIIAEFASCHILPPNAVRYAMRGISQSLYRQDWTLEIKKTGESVVTAFTPAKPNFENDSESEEG